MTKIGAICRAYGRTYIAAPVESQVESCDGCAGKYVAGEEWRLCHELGSCADNHEHHVIWKLKPEVLQKPNIKVYAQDGLEVGDRLIDSPVGAGILTDVTEAGYPRVNHVAVTWCEREDGAKWSRNALESRGPKIPNMVRTE
jgi:hypothetical protein